MGAASPGDKLDNFLLDECIPGENQANKIVQLDYEVPSAWAAFWIRLNGANITDYDTLTFYARGDADVGIPPEFKLELKGANNTTNVFYVSGLSEEWRYYEVSLESFLTPTGFSPICSWEDMGELVFTFESGVSGTKGRIYLDNIYLEQRQDGAPALPASCPAPTPTPDPNATQPPPPSTALVVSDFDTCGAPNNVGGGMGGAYNSPDSLIESYVEENERGCVARLEYDIQAWAAFWQKLQGQDLTPYSRLTFDLRGDAAAGMPGAIKIEIKRDNNSEVAITYIENITDSWQPFSVNLADFGPALSSWEGIEELVFTFEATRSGGEGVVYLDNVQFEP